MKNNVGIQKKLQHKGNAFQVYRKTVAGETGILYFLFYELYTTLINPLPGEFAVRLRRIFSPLIFANFGRSVILQKDVTFRLPGQISIGNNVFIEKGVTLDVKTSAGRIEIHDNVSIGKDTILSCPGGTITIGSGTSIGCSCRLGSLQGLTIGKHCSIGDYTCIVGAGHGYEDIDIPIIEQPLTCKGANRIGDDVKLGQEATVLDGVNIGSNVRVGAGSLVHRNVVDGLSVTGVPVG